MMRPNFEDQLDTVQDLVDNNITLVTIPGGQMWKKILEESSIPAHNEVAKTMIIMKGWHFFTYYPKYDIIGNGTHSIMVS